MSVLSAYSIGDGEYPPTPGATDRPSPASSPDLNSDPFLSFTGSSLLNGFGFVGRGGLFDCASEWNSSPSTSSSLDLDLELPNSPLDSSSDLALFSDDSIWDSFINSNLADIINSDTFPSANLFDSSSSSNGFASSNNSDSCGPYSRHHVPLPTLPLTSSLAMLLQQQLPPPTTTRATSTNATAVKCTSSSSSSEMLTKKSLHSSKINNRKSIKSINSSNNNNNREKTNATTTTFLVNTRPVNGGDHSASTMIKSSATSGSIAATMSNASSSNLHRTSNVITVQSGVKQTLRLNGSSITLKSANGELTTPVIITGATASGNQKLNAAGTNTTIGGSGVSATTIRPQNHIILNYADIAKSAASGQPLTLAGKSYVLATTSPLKRVYKTTQQPQQQLQNNQPPAKRLKDSSTSTSNTTNGTSSGNSVLMNLLLNGEDVSNGYAAHVKKERNSEYRTAECTLNTLCTHVDMSGGLRTAKPK